MRGKSVFLIVIALGCGLVASVGISQIMNRNPSGPVVVTKKIFVARVEMNINDPITAEMIQIEEWPQGLVPEGAIDQLEDIVGFAPRHRFYEGEAIIGQKPGGCDCEIPVLVDTSEMWRLAPRERGPSGPLFLNTGLR